MQTGPDATAYVDSAIAPNSRHIGRVSWGAIFAGVAGALITQLLLNMLGIGVGAASLDVGAGADNSGSGFSVGAGIWWVVAGIVAAFFGGLTAGRLAGGMTNGTARWHGLITWAVSTLIVFYLLTSAIGGVLGGAFNVIGSTISGASKTAAATASGVAGMGDGDAVARQVHQLIDPAGAQNLQDSVGDYLKASVAGDQQAAQQAKAQSVNALAQSAHITPAEASARLDQVEASAKQKYTAAKEKATQAAEATRKTVAAGAILGFVTLLLGAVAGWFGGGIGAGLQDRVFYRSHEGDGADQR